jgi:hypothetical protein
MATAKETCRIVPKSCLDHVISDIHIAQLAKSVTEWQELAPFLGLSRAEIKEIVAEYRGGLKLQTREALGKWKEKNGREATYQNLIKIFRKQDRVDLADIVEDLSTLSENEITGTGSSGISNSSVIDTFHDYLHDCYSELSHPSVLQWPNLERSSECYVELELLNVPVKGEVDDPNLVKAIPLKFLLAAGNFKAKRKVVLVEGVAGIGKTTLSWHACKEWAAGRLFENIKLLIHVSLNDRVFQSASELADLIPHPSKEVRTSVAKAIAEKRGKGICFLLEGCDEAPLSLWQSFLYRFVAGTSGRSMLPDAHIILTSRPAGIPIQVANCLTGKVVIKGFNLLEYISVLHLENEKQLLEVLEMRPELYSLCHLPLNAVILVYLHKFSDTLPSTRTGLFDLFVQHFLLRHMQTRTTAYCEISSIDNFPEGLPSDIFQSFTAISKLAYQSILERKRVIDQKLLGEFGFSSIDNAFGFLQVHQRLTMHGIHKQYTFIHLSLEEYLAAFHITQMDRHKQIEAVKTIFNQNPLSPVLTFYAGLSGLKIDEVQDLLLKVFSESIDIDDIVKKLGLNDPDSIHKVNLASDPRRHMLALMNCMYETHDPTVFIHVIQKLPTHDPQLTEMRRQHVRIRLLGMLLYPTDCLSIGSFIKNMIISQTHCDNIIKFLYSIDLSFCWIGDMEIKALAIDLQKPAVPSYKHKNYRVTISFHGIHISAGAINYLATLISTDSCIDGLDIDISLMENSASFLKYCIEGFINSSKQSLQPKVITLRSICYNPNFMHYLILLLRCPNLYGLRLCFGNQLLFTSPSAMPLFCEALKYSHLVWLNLSDCGIDNNLLKSLTSMVCHQSCTIRILELFHNPYSEHGLTCFLEHLLNFPFVRLHDLSVNHVNDDHDKQLKSINDIRKHNNWPILKIDQEDKFLLRIRNKEKNEAVNLLNYCTLMRPDLAFQSLHH